MKEIIPDSQIQYKNRTEEVTTASSFDEVFYTTFETELAIEVELIEEVAVRARKQKSSITTTKTSLRLSVAGRS